MTVAELIEELKKMPQEHEVWTEGCDCYGKASGSVSSYEDDKILIERDPLS